jgi:hypothetical protein
MSGADSPMASQIPKEVAHRILYARLALPGGGTLFAGDAPGPNAVSGHSWGIHHPQLRHDYRSAEDL